MSEQPPKDSGFGNPHYNPVSSYAPSTAVEAPKKLSSFMATSILLISVVGLASILLMYFGEFEGKVSRVISTLLIFAAFTTFTALDTRKDNPQRYMVISQAGNIYMLALSLVYIWGTIGAVGFYDEEIIPGTIGLILIIKVGVILLQKISDYIVLEQQQLSFASFLSGIAIGAATVIFTLPIALHHIFEFGEGYWKLAVGILMFGGLTISVTALLAWFFKEKKEDDTAPVLKAFNKDASQPSPHVNSREQNEFAPAPVVHRQDTKAQNVSLPSEAPQFAPPVRSSLPWPVFPNGYPLPAKANGRPDFEALKQMSEMYIEGERQFFG